MKRLLTLGILLLCWGARAAGTIWDYSVNRLGPSNASFAEVSRIIATNYVKDGDTVKIPADTQTWSSTLTITKAISLIGAGTNSTIINRAGISWKTSADKPIRLSGIKFIFLDSDDEPIKINGANTAVRVDHCFFEKGMRPLVFNSDNWVTANGPVYGVVDHCIFHNCARAMYVCDAENTDSNYPILGGQNYGATQWRRWTVSHIPFVGTTNQMVYENCAVTHDAGFSSPVTDPTSIYGQGGGVRCFRYCTFNGAYAYMDKHGDNPDYSVECYETYSNVFTLGSSVLNTAGDAFSNNRGGMAVHHDNIFNNGPNGESHDTLIDMVRYWHDEVNINTNVYWWNNKWNGSYSLTIRSNIESAGLVGPAAQITLKEHCCGSDPNSYAGCDLYPTICSTASIRINEQFWTNAPQSGPFYPYDKRSDGGWGQLPYPHPLVTYYDGGTANSAPTNLRISTQSANLSVGSALTLTANWDGGVPTPDIQWYYGATSNSMSIISGAITNPFSIASAQTNDSGWYEFSATNIYGGGTSAPVYISVTVPPPFNPPRIAGTWTNYEVGGNSLDISNINFSGHNKAMVLMSYTYTTGTGAGLSSATYIPNSHAFGDVPDFASLTNVKYSSTVGTLEMRILPTLFGGPGALVTTPSGTIGEGAEILALLTNSFLHGVGGFESPVAFSSFSAVGNNSLAVPSTTGELVIDVVVSSAFPFTPSGGQTLLKQFQLPQPQGTWLQASYKFSDTNASSTAMAWSSSQNDVISHIAVAAKAVPPPIMTNHPSATTNVAGATISVAALAAGSDDITYQWAKNSEPITNTAYTGVQTTNLTLAHASWRDSGYYSVLTTNSVGIIASEPVYVEIAHPPYKAAGVGRMGRSRW